MTKTRIAAWDDMDDRRETLVLFDVDDEGASRLCTETIPADEQEDRNEALRDAGARIGRTYGNTEYVWVADEQGFTVWTASGVAYEQAVPTDRITSVVAFYDAADRGHRGVTAGGQLVVEQHDSTASNDPTYNQDDFSMDAIWTSYIARDLATWLGVPLEDQIARYDNKSVLRIRATAEELAQDVAYEPETGTFDHVVHSIGTVEPAGELAMRFAPNPLDPSRRFLELRVSSPSSKTTSGRWIKQGTNTQIARFLREVRMPALALRTMHALLHAQKTDGYA
jgi:hypothetical protein